MCDKYSHGPTRGDSGIIWRIWAPRAENVQLMLFAGDSHRAIEMSPQQGGWFEAGVAGVVDAKEGGRYAFHLGGDRVRPDPASRWQPDGVHHPSGLFFAEDFHWSDTEWRGVARAELVFYELHVGTFTAAGTFDAVIPRLAELRDLGITAIEVMPVSQFPGSRGWGYDGVHPFAVQNSYGGPRGLQRLVDACHSHGLAVFLDVVYNHLGPEGNYLDDFGPYFTEKYHTPWGAAPNFDDVGCDSVRRFVLDNVRYWLREFHFDGLRLDAVQTIVDQSPVHILQAIQQVADEESAASGRTLHIVAESNMNDVRLVDGRDRHGYGLATVWNDDFHHSVHTLLTGEMSGYYSEFGQPEQLVKSLNDNFVYDGCHSPYHGKPHGTSARHLSGEHFVVAIQNHDQVGNRAVGDRFGSMLTPEQQRLAAGTMLLSPFLPLLFMGEEYGEHHPFPFFCSFGDEPLIEAVRQGRRREFTDFEWPDQLPDPQSEETFRSAQLSWAWPDGSWQAGLREWYRTLLHFRRLWPALRDDVHRAAFWHDRTGMKSGVPAIVSEPVAHVLLETGSPLRNRHHGILELIRGGTDSQGNASRIIAYLNFSDRSQDLADTIVEREAAPEHLPLLSSEWPRFGGRYHDDNSPPRVAKSWRLLPFEVLVLSLPVAEIADDDDRVARPDAPNNDLV
jgi:maltooligosyltrehalose trehalohydrolase